MISKQRPAWSFEVANPEQAAAWDGEPAGVLAGASAWLITARRQGRVE
jgi:hypothetical protein